jgi:predicted dehydrogenase
MGGGVILDLIHEIDYMCWLFGNPRRVFCMCGRHSSLEIDTEDVAEILLECEKAPLVGIHMDYVQRKPCRTCTIIGENGTIRWDYHTNTVSVHTADTVQTKEYALGSFDRNQMYRDELMHFIRCLQGKEEPMVGLKDARKSLEIALLARRSGQDRKEYTFS